MTTKVSEASVSARVRGGSSDELAVIAQRAQAFTNASGAAIALSEGNAAEIFCRARAGSSAPEVGTVLPVEGTFTGLCIQSGQELLCDDAETDTRVDKAAIRALGIRSMVAIPIKVEGRVEGVLAVFAPTAHAFRITHVVVLKTMADQIAAYLHRPQRDEAYSPEPLPALPVKAVTVSAAASPTPPPAVVTKPAEPALKHRELSVVRKFGPVRATKSAEEIDPATMSQKKETNSHDEQKESETHFRRGFGTLDAAAAPENRPGTSALMIGAAAVVVIAVAIGLSFKLRKPDAAKQPAPEAWSSPGTPAAPATASSNVQPPANIPPDPLAKHDEPHAKREEIVVLPAGLSKISEARDNSAPMSDAPAISVGDVPASGSLSNLVSPVSQPPHPQLLTPSEFEPVTTIKEVRPVYPLGAKHQKLTGSVVVQGTVDKNGRISDLQMISGSPLLRDAAFAAVKQWVFKPATLNGQAIERSTTIHLYFGAQ